MERRQGASPFLRALLAEWTHLPELAPRADARVCARVRAHSRADAPEAARSFKGLLEAGHGSLPEIHRSPQMAARERRAIGYMKRPASSFQLSAASFELPVF